VSKRRGLLDQIVVGTGLKQVYDLNFTVAKKVATHPTPQPRQLACHFPASKY
jgi:hypothetical protein